MKLYLAMSNGEWKEQLVKNVTSYDSMQTTEASGDVALPSIDVDMHCKVQAQGYVYCRVMPWSLETVNRCSMVLYRRS